MDEDSGTRPAAAATSASPPSLLHRGETADAAAPGRGRPRTPGGSATGSSGHAGPGPAAESRAQGALPRPLAALTGGSRQQYRRARGDGGPAGRRRPSRRPHRRLSTAEALARPHRHPRGQLEVSHQQANALYCRACSTATPPSSGRRPSATTTPPAAAAAQALEGGGRALRRRDDPSKLAPRSPRP